MLGDVGRCWAMLGDVWAMLGVCGIRSTVESVLSLGPATFLRLVGRRCAFRYGGQGRRKDAAGKTDVAGLRPVLWVNELAEGRGARSVGGFVGSDG
eukprot:scaffold20685_cov82-Amphora_coffeaeformis.AAC.1